MTLGIDATGGAYVDGRFNVPGGVTDAGNYFDRVQIYDGTAWTVDPDPIPLAGWSSGAVCTDGRTIHLVNGSADFLDISAHQVYDPAAPVGDRWRVLRPPALPDGREYVSSMSGCTFIDGVMYLYGGYGSVDPGLFEWLDDTWAWNPAGDSWTDTGHQLNVRRTWFSYSNGAGLTSAYAAGGWGDPVNYLASVERFDPTTGWQLLSRMPVKRYGSGLGVVGDRLVVFAGANYNGFVESTIMCQLPCRQGWTATPFPINVHRIFAAWATGERGGDALLYLAGGDTGDIETRVLETFLAR
jgi:hypothetical protein